MKKDSSVSQRIIDKVKGWAQSHSLWFYYIDTQCCADELSQTISCRYDIERFGSVQVFEPEQADLLIVNGSINSKLESEIKKIYEQMSYPKYVMALGACACSAAPFQCQGGRENLKRLDQIVPVDVYVPGCPPRPEAIMNGLINLQIKIKGRTRNLSWN